MQHGLGLIVASCLQALLWFAAQFIPWIGRVQYQPCLKPPKNFISDGGALHVSEADALIEDLMLKLAGSPGDGARKGLRWFLASLCLALAAAGIWSLIARPSQIRSDPRGVALASVCVVIIVGGLLAYLFLIRTVSGMWKQMRDSYRNPDLEFSSPDFFLDQAYPNKLNFLVAARKALVSIGTASGQPGSGKTDEQTSHQFWQLPVDPADKTGANQPELTDYITYDLVRKAGSYPQLLLLSNPVLIKQFYNSEPTKLRGKIVGMVDQRDWSPFFDPVKDRLFFDLFVNGWNPRWLDGEVKFSAGIPNRKVDQLFTVMQKYANLNPNIVQAIEDLNTLLHMLESHSPVQLADSLEQETIEKRVKQTTDITEERATKVLNHLCFMNLVQYVWALRHFHSNERRFSILCNRWCALFAALGFSGIWWLSGPGVLQCTSIEHGLLGLAWGIWGVIWLLTMVFSALVWLNLVGTGCFRLTSSDLQIIDHTVRSRLDYRLKYYMTQRFPGVLRLFSAWADEIPNEMREPLKQKARKDPPAAGDVLNRSSVWLLVARTVKALFLTTGILSLALVLLLGYLYRAKVNVSFMGRDLLDCLEVVVLILAVSFAYRMVQRFLRHRFNQSVLNEAGYLSLGWLLERLSGHPPNSPRPTPLLEEMRLITACSNIGTYLFEFPYIPVGYTLLIIGLKYFIAAVLT